jgi:rSAM/selenodomain-associated transferase 1
LKAAVIIFARNPVPGKVKTRIAQTMGDEKALSIYKELLQHTMNETKQLAVDKYVFYADYINANDVWDNIIYKKELQQGDELGERMKNAFEALFAAGYERVVIIGTDCYERGLAEAFELLLQRELVIGPSHDGGYYLLGMTKLFDPLFKCKNWSTETVYKQTLEDIQQLKISYKQLPVLSDIDTAEDWINYHTT